MKTKKILGLLMVVFAAAGMAACGTTDSTHTHEFKNVEDSRNVAPTCTSTGIQIQKCECGEEKETKVAKLKHTLVDDSARNKDATCTESGIANAQKCSVCGEETQTVIRALGHDWVDDEDQTGVTPATCTEAGESKQHCSRCDEHQTVEVAALGHTWDEFEITKEAKCEEAGSRKHKCTVCGEEETEEIAALGHNFQLVGEQVEPAPGKATVRVYSCVNEGCDKTNLGFKATEVTEASKEHLVFEPADGGEGVEQGARFWGRPIGNAVALDENGSANSSDHEPIFDKNETGDFFEYIFDLTAEQAAELSNCRLYCDAKPAAYLNGQDFWACDPTAEEWTPGFYIDDDPAHLNEDGTGKRIDSYRYILYVDDEVKEFDSSIKAPVTGGAGREVRAEYVMPYTFKLHAGENKISLRMAGGYRSLFYNFIFRAVEEETPVVPVECDHTSVSTTERAGDATETATTYVECLDCGQKTISWNAKKFIEAESNNVENNATYIRFNGVENQGGTESKGSHIVYEVYSPVAVNNAKLSINAEFNAGAPTWAAANGDNTPGYVKDADGNLVPAEYRYGLLVNGVNVELNEAEHTNPSGAKHWEEMPAVFNLKAGLNKIELVSFGGYRAKMYEMKIVG